MKRARGPARPAKTARPTSKLKSPVTMADLAELAGLSTSTVSRALEDNPLIAKATRERVQALARQHKYSVNPVARSLRSRRSGTIGVIIPLLHEADQPLSDPFFMLMLGHLTDALSAQGYDLLLSKVSVHAEDWVDRMIATRRADAVIVIGQSLEHEAINQAARQGVPVVAWGAKLRGQAYATVGSDNHEGGRLAAAHLLESGRRRIAFLGNRALPEVARRYEGFVQAHKDHGVAVNPALIVDAHFGRQDAQQASRALVAAHADFDGAVSASDVIAISLIKALNEAGRRVPQDVGVVGFDDTPTASYSVPRLTTIQQDVARGAGLLVEQALAAIRGEAGVSTEMPVHLVVRESTAR